MYQGVRSVPRRELGGVVDELENQIITNHQPTTHRTQPIIGDEFYGDDTDDIENLPEKSVKKDDNKTATVDVVKAAEVASEKAAEKESVVKAAPDIESEENVVEQDKLDKQVRLQDKVDELDNQVTDNNVHDSAEQVILETVEQLVEQTIKQASEQTVQENTACTEQSFVQKHSTKVIHAPSTETEHTQSTTELQKHTVVVEARGTELVYNHSTEFVQDHNTESTVICTFNKDEYTNSEVKLTPIQEFDESDWLTVEQANDILDSDLVHRDKISEAFDTVIKEEFEKQQFQQGDSQSN